MELTPSRDIEMETPTLISRIGTAVFRFTRSLLDLSLFLLFIAITIAMIWLWVTDASSRELLLWLVVGIAFIGVFPISYLVYLGFGGENAQRQRLRDDFRLLGLVSEEELDETVEKLYQTVYGKGQFLAYIGLIMLVSALVLASYRFNEQLTGIISPETGLIMFYSYLGAYVFSVQAIIRRYNTADLQPQVYSSSLVRMLVALVLTFVGASVIQLSGAQLTQGAGGTAVDAMAWAAILAFTIGVFPDSGLRWFLQQSARVLNSPTDQSSERPLRNIIGISTWHEARLSEMAIDDAQNLATVDIRKLLLTTQFDVQEIISWIDQSILYTKVGDKIDRFRDAKISTFYEFRQTYSELKPSLYGRVDDKQLEAQIQAQERLAVSLGLLGIDELSRLVDDANYPNYAYIAEYYSRTATVARRRADRGMNFLLGARLETDFKRAVAELKRRLAHNPKDARLYFDLGFAYYKLNEREKACDAYSKAISLDDSLAEAYANRSFIRFENGEYEAAISDSTWALTLNPTDAEAHNSRGLTYMKMGYLDQAIKDFNEALHLNDRLAKAYFSRGFAYSEQADFEKALADFERAYLLGYREDALLWFRWGEDLLKRGDFQEAITKLSRALLIDSRLTLAFARRGYAYLQLGELFFNQAATDFRMVTEKAGKDEGDMNSLLAAYTNWGLLEARRNHYTAAVEKYQAALQLDENYFAARYNLAVAYYHLDQLSEAQTEFQTLTDTAPEEAYEAQRAYTWLTRLRGNSTGPATAGNGTGIMNEETQLNEV